MGRFAGAIESQVAQTSGVNATTTVNGYVGGVRAGASQNFKLRRLILGTRGPSGVPNSQQITIGVYRQTVAAVGTGITLATAGFNLDPRGGASAIAGLDVTTATTIGTTGPTLTNKMFEFTFNSQSPYDIPAEYLEEWICDQGTANGFALVILGVALPASHLLTASFEWEE
jgi:hypothetical protein